MGAGGQPAVHLPSGASSGLLTVEYPRKRFSLNVSHSLRSLAMLTRLPKIVLLEYPNLNYAQNVEGVPTVISYIPWAIRSTVSY